MVPQQQQQRRTMRASAMSVLFLVFGSLLLAVAPRGAESLLPSWSSAAASTPSSSLFPASGKGGAPRRSQLSPPKQCTPTTFLSASRGTVPLFTTEEEEAGSIITAGEEIDPESASLTTIGKKGKKKATVVLADSKDFVKPDQDRRKYRTIRLANNLEVVLVSDQLAAGSTGTEAASVHVQAGHFDDTVPGLAHFHEHMLFLGTEKYPDEDEYESFLSQYGGHCNAYTDMEDTNYYFSVTTPANADGTTSEALEGGLDRLAQFFINPTFDRDAVDRELRAIDSEYRNAKTSDSWRNFQLLKSTCDSRHPFSKFGCGNYETLTSQGHDRLLVELEKFWKAYYRTYNMKLAVVGHGTLDNLQATVERTFGQLAHSNEKPRRVKSLKGQQFERENAVYGVQRLPGQLFEGNGGRSGYVVPAFGPQQVGVWRDVVPFTEMRSLKVYFATPPLDDPAIRPTKPYRVISHLLGHEAPGSLHAVLNAEGYIQGLSSGVGIDTSDFSLFSLSLALTPLGMEHKDDVLNLLFQWIAMVRENENTLELYHKELRQLAGTNFRFRENGDPTDFCSSAAELLFDEGVPPARLLLGSLTTEDYEPDVARAFLDRLRPENCMITVLDSDFMKDKRLLKRDRGGEWETEPWYGATFRVRQLTDEQKRAWEFPAQIDSRLKLPALNQYIPTDFSLRCDDSRNLVFEFVPDSGETDDDDEEDDDTSSSTSPEEMTMTTLQPKQQDEEGIRAPPHLLIDAPSMRMWHKMDRHWRVPKSYIRVALLSSKSYQTPRTMTLARIFQRVLSDDLNSFVYDASIAGCGYSVSCTPLGYRISVRGYSEKLPFLLDTLTTRILSLIEEMKEGANPSLLARFEKAKEGLLRETKNYRLDPPHEVANYNSRLLIEENVWYLDNYISEMEGETASNDPLTLAECAEVAKECFTGRVKCEALCMGNIDEKECREVSDVLDWHFLKGSRTLSEAETPRFRSLKLPTQEEAVTIFGAEVEQRGYPLVYQDTAFSDSEENNAVEVILQVGCELDLGYEGVAILDLITHMAYNSAYNQLRTKEQLGYIVSAFSRKTSGSTWGMSIVVQGSVALPEALEERCEAWLETFRDELQDMSPDDLAKEASAVVAQLLESETKLSQEVGRVFGDILNTEGLSDRLRTPAFDRLEKLAQELRVGYNTGTTGEKIQTPTELKRRVLQFFYTHFEPGSPDRRAMSARVYSQNSMSHYDDDVGRPGILSSHSEMRHCKQYLSSWPSVPYWRVEDKYKDPAAETSAIDLPLLSSSQ